MAQLARDLRRYKRLHVRGRTAASAARFRPQVLRRIAAPPDSSLHLGRGCQELVHAYLLVGRLQALDAAMSLLVRSRIEVWPLAYEDVTLARQLHEQYPALGARDLCHLASCRRRGVRTIKTFDQALRAVGETPPNG